MQFGSKSIAASMGAVLAHSLRIGGRRLKKGHVLSAADIVALEQAGHREVTVACLDENDIGEDEAAARIAGAFAGHAVRTGAAFTGRANLYAEADGIALVDTARVDLLNDVDESITVATVAPFARVKPRQMLATIKIIPFAAPRRAVEAAMRMLDGGAVLRVACFVPRSAALISTALPDTRAALLDKNRSVLGARLDALGSSLALERRVPHQTRDIAVAIAEALDARADPILVFGASAITDRQDVVPTGIVEAGGVIEHFGMPVDPGNLLLLGRIHGVTVIGLPGCARSPKRNGFDFVLERTLANIPIGRAEIAAMGVGGLLAEIPTRPQPREERRIEAPHAPAIVALVLAAGLSSRMGHNKLLADVGGTPLIRRVVEAAVNSHANEVVVVTGNDAENVAAALSGLPVKIVQNQDFRAGLSASLKKGIQTLPQELDGAIVMLGDMPDVSSHLIDTLIAAFNPEEGRAICVATHGGKRGNPVLWSRQFFPEIGSLEGDVGAKHLIVANEELVCEVEIADESPLLDIDTPEALAAYTDRDK